MPHSVPGLLLRIVPAVLPLRHLGSRGQAGRPAGQADRVGGPFQTGAEQRIDGVLRPSAEFMKLSARAWRLMPAPSPATEHGHSASPPHDSLTDVGESPRFWRSFAPPLHNEAAAG